MDYIYDDYRIYAKNSNGKEVLLVEFPLKQPGIVEITRVYVDPSMRGGGMASSLMEQAYTKIKGKKLKAVAVCPYAKSWFEKHESYQDILQNESQKGDKR